MRSTRSAWQVWRMRLKTTLGSRLLIWSSHLLFIICLSMHVRKIFVHPRSKTCLLTWQTCRTHEPPGGFVAQLPDTLSLPSLETLGFTATLVMKFSTQKNIVQQLVSSWSLVIGLLRMSLVSTQTYQSSPKHHFKRIVAHRWSGSLTRKTSQQRSPHMRAPGCAGYSIVKPFI